MRLLLSTALFTGCIFLTACSGPKIINVDNHQLAPSDKNAFITRGTSKIWYLLGFCGTDAHVVAIDGKVLTQFSTEKSRIGLPYNPDFDYVLAVSPGDHEFILALKKCHFVAYQLEGCYLDRLARCNVNVESNHNYAVKGFGCSPEKGINFIDVDSNKVTGECRDVSQTSSPWIHEALRDFLNN